MPHLKCGFDLLDQKSESLRAAFQPKSLLYVGWRHDCRGWWHESFAKNIGAEKLGILEVFPPNFENAKRAFPGASVFLGDVREMHRDERFKPGDWDVIFWDHGPEHVSLSDLRKTTPELLKLCKLLVYACPYGDWPQGPDGGNEHEVHRNAVMPEHFRDDGMVVFPMGAPGVGLGEIVALGTLTGVEIP